MKIEAMIRPPIKMDRESAERFLAEHIGKRVPVAGTGVDGLIVGGRVVFEQEWFPVPEKAAWRVNLTIEFELPDVSWPIQVSLAEEPCP